jgi:hypothetical protein
MTSPDGSTDRTLDADVASAICALGNRLPLAPNARATACTESPTFIVTLVR